MNDYMMGHIHACLKLPKTAKEFKKNVKKVTGLTEIGYKEAEIDKMWKTTKRG